MVFCWLEADNNGIVHAGEHLRVIIHIKSKDNSPITVLLAAVTLCGNLHYDEKFLNLPKHSKSVINVGSAYGTILDTPKQSSRAIFICPSTVIMTNERIEEQVDYSCKSFIYLLFRRNRLFLLFHRWMDYENSQTHSSQYKWNKMFAYKISHSIDGATWRKYVICQEPANFCWNAH